MRPDNRPLPRTLPQIEAGCGAVLVRLPCGTTIALDPEGARRTGQALIDAGRNALPRRNPANLPEALRQPEPPPRWMVLPVAFFLAASLLAMPSLMFSGTSSGLLVLAVLLAALITAPITRAMLRRGRSPRPSPATPHKRRVLRLVGGRDVRPGDIRTVTQRIGKPVRRG